MRRIQATFAKLNGQKALIPFIMAGDPNLDSTLAIMLEMANSGADIIELGVPFSDPMADGPTIQRAAERALIQKTSLSDIIQLVTKFREHNTSTPVILMGYLNIILSMGYIEFAKRAAQAGIDGLLSVDCPSDEIHDLHAALNAHNLDCIVLIAPTTPHERMIKIVEKASGFIYYVSLNGVTGAADLEIDAVARKIADLRTCTSLPVAVGFGIKTPKTAAQIAHIADAVIIGSCLVDIIEQYPHNAAPEVGTLIRAFKAAI